MEDKLISLSFDDKKCIIENSNKIGKIKHKKKTYIVYKINQKNIEKLLDKCTFHNNVNDDKINRLGNKILGKSNKNDKKIGMPLC